MVRNVCGLDVHKNNVFVCILKENGEKISEKLGILTPELDSLREMLIAHGVGEVCMESTGVYWMPIWRAGVRLPPCPGEPLCDKATAGSQE